MTGKRRTSSVDENDPTAKKEKAVRLIAMQKKFLTGDLGQHMSADVNYSVKRLVRGLASDSHHLKKGFYLAFSQVLDRFRKQIDC